MGRCRVLGDRGRQDLIEQLGRSRGLRAISGPQAAAAATLQVLPSQLTQWADWQARHPEIPIRLHGETLPMTTELLEKYNVQGPRYTSYPTAPHFTPAFGVTELRRHMAAGNAAARPLSLYVHVPFCA